MMKEGVCGMDAATQRPHSPLPDTGAEPSGTPTTTRYSVGPVGIFEISRSSTSFTTKAQASPRTFLPACRQTIRPHRLNSDIERFTLWKRLSGSGSVLRTMLFCWW